MMQTRWNSSRKAATGILVAMSLCLSAAAFAAEKTFDRTLTVNGPVTLHVSTGAGYIHVSPGSDSQVHIVGHVKGSNSWWGGGSSDEAVAKVADNPPIDQAGNIIRVGEEHGGECRRAGHADCRHRSRPKKHRPPAPEPPPAAAPHRTR